MPQLQLTFSSISQYRNSFHISRPHYDRLNENSCSQPRPNSYCLKFATSDVEPPLLEYLTCSQVVTTSPSFPTLTSVSTAATAASVAAAAASAAAAMRYGEPTTLLLASSPTSAEDEDFNNGVSDDDGETGVVNHGNVVATDDTVYPRSPSPLPRPRSISNHSPFSPRLLTFPTSALDACVEQRFSPTSIGTLTTPNDNSFFAVRPTYNENLNVDKHGPSDDVEDQDDTRNLQVMGHEVDFEPGYATSDPSRFSNCANNPGNHSATTSVSQMLLLTTPVTKIRNDIVADNTGISLITGSDVDDVELDRDVMREDLNHARSATRRRWLIYYQN